ncbi:hypothetical protein SAMN02745117_00521 [Lampropedia hyalina DSM 16112]|jgi:vacuolar-type H+-ATPase subunit I/STV1|uniref:Phasin protein n=1 Tax=Lampropedia hyalina DSM 16112 TaxID=1122156 RepID=A0A1M4UMH5_9BURK|nr:hypothetical protein [Lampropedia hyalina]SHE57858.1 hypothetical protein SAMN02745117_00521 [Lampropedia hyalina DSM 16112]
MTAPFDFYKSSLELWAKTTKDLQTGSQQWLDEVIKTANADLAQTNAELQQLVQEQNWAALASLPQQAAWRAYIHQVSAWQTAVQELAQQQPDFNTGIQKALEGWQTDSVKAVTDKFGELNNPAALQQYWQSFFTQALPTAQTKKTRG